MSLQYVAVKALKELSALTVHLRRHCESAVLIPLDCLNSVACVPVTKHIQLDLMSWTIKWQSFALVAFPRYESLNLQKCISSL